MPVCSRVFVAFLIVALALGCQRSFDEGSWKARGAEAILPFKKQLKQALLSGLEKGPTEAIQACRFEAPKIANSVSHSKLKIGRTSHKLRNPDNAPRDWMVPLLNRYLGGAKDPIAVRIDRETVGYVEPIVTEALCLTCHGASLAPAIQEEVAKYYPSDAATGFEVGELRGLFWAELSD